VAAFVALIAAEGLHHANRASAVLALSDVGDGGGNTVVQLLGNRGDQAVPDARGAGVVQVTIAGSISEAVRKD
jgi:hypothetical protein